MKCKIKVLRSDLAGVFPELKRKPLSLEGKLIRLAEEMCVGFDRLGKSSMARVAARDQAGAADNNEVSDAKRSDH